MKRKMKVSIISILLLCMVFLVLVACGDTDTTSSEESITLTYAGIVPETHDLYIYGTQVFIEEVEKLSDGQVEIEFYPNGQLGSTADMINLANSGTADIVEAAPSYIPGQMPLGNAFQLPGALPDADTGSEIIWEVLKNEESIIRKTDFTDNGLVPLFAGTLPLYQIITTENNELASFEDIQGLKLRSAGGVQDLTVDNLDAVPVSMDLSDYYQALERGTLDGGIFNLPSLEANNTHEVLNNLTTNANVSGFVAPASISKDTWEQLSSEVQEVLIEAGEAAASSMANNMEKSNEKILQNLLDQGFGEWTLTDDELEQLNEMISPTWERWVEDMESLGFDGQAAIDEMNEALQEFE